jgi:poly-gamma-glutamate capsule biosynthesis protein CapA/YwtB (metallophosphatase superfamily)
VERAGGGLRAPGAERDAVLAVLVMYAVIGLPVHHPTPMPLPEPAPIRIAAVGDIALAPANDDGAGLFQHVQAPLSADLVFGNLEGTLASSGSPRCSGGAGCYTFRAPPAYAARLRGAGFTLLNVANNHALDYGAEGQSETLAALRRARLRWTGRPDQIAYLRFGPTRVAVLGFAPYPWAQSLLDIRAAEALVRRAAAKADVVIVTMHAGAEGHDHGHVTPGTEYYLGENRGNVAAFAHAVVVAGADLVVGHGPHVLRGLEWYHGRLIAYSLGNFLGNGTLNTTGSGGVSCVLEVSLGRDGGWVGGRVVPIRLVQPGIPERDPTGTARAVLRTLSHEDFGARAMHVAADGSLLPPDRGRRGGPALRRLTSG